MCLTELQSIKLVWPVLIGCAHSALHVEGSGQICSLGTGKLGRSTAEEHNAMGIYKVEL